MLDIAIKGILIGLCISVPLGPIGMLTIQRTLTRGQKYGIATGLGATASDLFYTVITLFFLSLVLDFVEAHRFAIQLGGSFVVVAFGYYIYRSNPSRQPKPNESKKYSLAGDFFSSFALTLSNPLVLFVLIALFARFEFITNKSTFPSIVIGILSILGGAFSWWTFITFIISRFRNRLGMRELKIINQIIGVVIILIGCIGFVMSMKK